MNALLACQRNIRQGRLQISPAEANLRGSPASANAQIAAENFE
jgi:hypothetical protein